MQQCIFLIQLKALHCHNLDNRYNMSRQECLALSGAMVA